MKLGTLKDDTRDGKLVVVSRDLSQCVAVPEIARTLQAVLDDWKAIAPCLDEVYRALNAGSRKDAKPFDAERGPRRCRGRINLPTAVFIPRIWS